MRFILMISEDHEAPTRDDADQSRLIEQHRRLGDELRVQGRWVDAGRLRPATEAVTVRASHGRWVVTDGPFAETKDALGGYYVIECETRAEAVEWAKRIPAFDYGAVEVRALF
jgi:hypothetical protein